MFQTALSTSTFKEINSEFLFDPIVIDQFLNSSEFLALSEEFYYMNMQLCNWSDTNDIRLFFGVKQSNRPVHIDCLAPSVSLKVQKRIRKKLYLKRIHINGQVYGQEGKFHRDSQDINDISVLIFTNQTWAPSWGGCFSYIKEPSPETFTVAYVPNRAVIFPSAMLHCGQAPLSTTDMMRTSIVFVFKADDI